MKTIDNTRMNDSITTATSLKAFIETLKISEQEYGMRYGSGIAERMVRTFAEQQIIQSNK